MSTLVDIALGTTTATDGQIVVVSGTAGIGKSRLLAEAVHRLSRQGRAVALARAAPIERDFAYGVVRQLFEAELRAGTGTGRERLLAGAAAQAAGVFGPDAAAAGPLGDLAVLHGLYWLVVNACADTPRILIIDDVQYADAPTLRLLAYLRPRLDGLPLTLVLAHTVGSPVPDTLAELLHAPGTRIVRPEPLTLPGGTALLAAVFGIRPDRAFAAVCHEATGGNPLLLTQLAHSCVTQGIRPISEDAEQVATLRPAAVADRMGMHLAALPAEVVAVAYAVALLGEGADLPAVAAVAGTGIEAAATAADRLVQARLLVRAPDGGALDYPHRLLRVAAYEHAGPAVRVRGHRAAAGHLAAVGAEPERIAAHLLRVPPGVVPNAADRLACAADTALSRGSPQCAHIYLERALTEPTTEPRRLALLDRLADVALHTDVAVAARCAAQVLESTVEPPDRAVAGLRLGGALLLSGDTDGAVDAWRAARAELTGVAGPAAAELDDLRLALDAFLVNVTILEPGRLDLLAEVGPVPDDGAPAGPGARALDCALGFRAAFEARRSAAASARRGLSDGLLIRHGNADSLLACGWVALLSAEDDAARESLAHGRQEAYRQGSVRAYGPVHAFAALDQLWRGNLAEAEREGRAAVEAVERSGVRLGRPFVAPILADVLAERGDLTGAAAAMAWAGLPEEPPSVGPMYFYADTRARLLRRAGHAERAAEAALDAGRLFAAFRGDNPALVPWRTEAARALHQIGRSERAAELALAEVALARHWGAPRPLGRALRVAGVVLGPHQGFALLTEAVDVLAGSLARLEYTKALVTLAEAAGRRGDRAWARELLDTAVTLAASCDCPPLLDRVHAALVAVGVRRAAREPGDAAVLTSSERRVAELAAAGLANREIAETLFVTPKTVELHLTNTYRKLRISGRVQLVTALAAATPPVTAPAGGVR
uniref:AAA family ATPase n=2 Tax=Micromonospora TaxID=1873 RepID=A0A7D6GIV4_9ACTN|nr:AAA family ATPase [Micromonospora carbonacea]